jgi:hypothetical protein
MMLDRRVLRKEERHARHMLFLPQEVVKHEVWISGFQIMHNYKR